MEYKGQSLFCFILCPSYGRPPRRGEVTPPYECSPDSIYLSCGCNPDSSNPSVRAQSARSESAQFPAAFRREAPEQAGQACRSRPRKILRKSRGVYLTFTPLPAPWRRGLVRRADERGVSQKVSSELFEYLGGPQSPQDSQGESEAFPFSLPCIYPILSISGYIPRPRKTTPSNRKLRC